MIKKLEISFRVPSRDIALRVQALAGAGDSVLETAKSKVREELRKLFPNGGHAALLQSVSYTEGRVSRSLTHNEFVLADEEAWA